MNSITLTAEQAAQVLAGVREFVVPGDIKTVGARRYGQPMIKTVGARRYGQPMRVEVPVVPVGYVVPKQWADADGQRVELQEACPICEGYGLLPHLTAHGWVDDCPCCLKGRKRIAQATVEILPFREWASHLDPPSGRWATVTNSGWLAIQSCDGHTLVTSSTGYRFTGPFPVSGRDFMAVLTDVELVDAPAPTALR